MLGQIVVAASTVFVLALLAVGVVRGPPMFRVSVFIYGGLLVSVGLATVVCTSLGITGLAVVPVYVAMLAVCALLQVEVLWRYDFGRSFIRNA